MKLSCVSYTKEHDDELEFHTVNKKNYNHMKQFLLMVISLLLFPSCNKDDSNIEVEPPQNMGVNIRMVAGSMAFTVSLYDNSAAEAFLAMLPMVINMGEMNGNEKYYDLPDHLPAASVSLSTIRNGDLMLYGSRTLVLFYETFPTSYNYTRIGRVNNPSGLETALGKDRVTVKFEQIPEKTQYMLTYNANGATSGTVPLAVTADEGSNIILNNGGDLRKSGYVFAGWNTNPGGTGTNYPAGGSYAIDKDATLYAQWHVVINSNSMKVTIGTVSFTATLATSATAIAFKTMLPLTLNMSDFNNNEKVGSLPASLTTAASNPGTIHAGDIMLYGSSSLVLFYETFSTSYSYTKIGRIDDVSRLKAALGAGNVTMKIELE